MRRLQVKFLAALVAASVALLASRAAADDEPSASVAKFHGWVADLGFNQDGSQLIGVGGESLLFRPGFVRVWDVQSGEEIRSYAGHEACVWSVAVSPGGGLLTTDYNGGVRFLAAEDGEAKALVPKQTAWVRASAISPAGDLAAIGDERGMLQLLELPGGEVLRELSGHEGAIYDIAFSSDGTLLATAGTDQTAKLWVVGDAEGEPTALTGHSDAVWAVAFVPGTDLVATAGADKSVRLWNRDGSIKAVLGGHRDWVTDLAVSPDGSELATCDQDGAVRLWSLPEGDPLGQIDDLESSAWCIAYAPNGAALAVGSHEHGVRIYEKSWRVRLQAEAQEE